KTLYTYEIEYVVELNVDSNDFEENKYYPLNGDTYITINGRKVKFPIPATKGEKTTFTVTYTDGVDGTVFKNQ
ncbi:hypothetical protein RFZ01_04110, partial [Acinetobacter pittii]|uniref:hypothetical protein n=1 Tax=Acinetobacter pittii TaxID=48296 RepID=UPI0028147DBE